LDKEKIVEEIQELGNKVKEENIYSINEIMEKLSVDIYLFEEDLRNKKEVDKV